MNNTHFSNLKKFFAYTSAFILLVLISMFLNNLVKNFVADQIGYKGFYYRALGRTYYGSEEMEIQKKAILTRYAYDDTFFEEDIEWIEWEKKNTKNLSLINWSGHLFLFLVSAIGLSLYFSRRLKQKPILAFDWLLFFLGFFYMQDVVMHFLGLTVIGTDYPSIQIFDLPYPLTYYIWITAGLLFFLFLLYKLPEKNIFIFLLSGIIGGGIAATTWYTVMYKTHPSKVKYAIVKAGDSAAELKGIVHVSNDSFILSNYTDSIVVLDFLFSTCGPCRRALPNVNALYDKYRPQGVLFYGIDPIENDWPKLDLFVSKVKVNYPIVKVSEESARTGYGIRGYPTMVILNKGKIILKEIGHEETIKKADKILGEIMTNSENR